MPLLEVEVVDVETDCLGDPRTGAVQHLEQRAVAQGQRRSGGSGRLEDPLDVGQRQRLRQPLGRRRRLDGSGRVAVGQPFAHHELVEATHRDDRARRASRAQRLVVGVALTQLHQELRDVPRLDRGDVVDAAGVEEADVAPQVAAVRRKRVGREATLDRQVVEIGADDARRLLLAQAEYLVKARATPSRAPRRPARW